MLAGTRLAPKLPRIPGGAMQERVDPQPSAFQVIHASTFSLGLVALMAAAVTADPRWYLLSGPALIASGVLILLGCRITFRGPIGQMLRTALGPGFVRRATARGWVWLLIGVLISVWGAVSVGRWDNAATLAAIDGACASSAREPCRTPG